MKELKDQVTKLWHMVMLMDDDPGWRDLDDIRRQLSNICQLMDEHRYGKEE